MTICSGDLLTKAGGGGGMGTAGLHTKQESQNCLDNSKRLCRNVFVMVILN